MNDKNLNVGVRCGCCKSTIEPERVELGLQVCFRCAMAGKGQPRYKGAMIYSHKTAGVLEVMSPRRYQIHMSCARNQGKGGGFSSSTSSLAVPDRDQLDTRFVA